MMSNNTDAKFVGNRSCTLCLFAFLLVFLGGLLTWWSYSSTLNDKTVTTKPTPVIIFKLPRTGSSWFTQELNRYPTIKLSPLFTLFSDLYFSWSIMFSIPTVYISKEILQRSDHGKFSSEEMEAQLIQALTSPTGKMSSKDRLSPDGRYIEDYLMHKTLKPFRSLDVIGFSVNPEHCRSKNNSYLFFSDRS